MGLQKRQKHLERHKMILAYDSTADRLSLDRDSMEEGWTLRWRGSDYAPTLTIATFRVASQGRPSTERVCGLRVDEALRADNLRLEEAPIRAPRGQAFLWVDEFLQEEGRPLATLKYVDPRGVEHTFVVDF
jgi:hypothetical protein